MDCRHVDPVIDLTAHVDWSNPALYWFVGFFGAIVAAIVLTAV
jgi:hypothetical protein